MNPIQWAIAAAFAALLAGAGVQTVRVANAHTDIANLKAEHAQRLALMTAAHDKAMKEARDRENQWATNAANFAQERQDETNDVRSQLADALERLRNRPERPATPASGASAPAAVAKGATGADLFREDGQFLRREAARADVLRSALNECYRRYDDVAQVKH